MVMLNAGAFQMTSIWELLFFSFYESLEKDEKAIYCETC